MRLLNLNFSKSLSNLDLNYYKIIALFRILVISIAIIDFSSVFIDLNSLISNNSILPWELGLLESEYYLFLKPLYFFLENNGISISFFITTISILYLLILICCGLGFQTKKSFFIAIILQLIIFRTIPNFNYGYDNFITMSFFYCLIFPVNFEFSFDKAKIIVKEKNAQSKYFSLILFLKTHLSIIYIVSGLAKAVDVNWWNGNAIWRSLATLNDFIYINPFILAIISSFTVILEISYPFLAFSRFKNLRKILIIHIILMHLGIGIFLGLSSFASIMIVWNIFAFHKDFIKQ